MFKEISGVTSPSRRARLAGLIRGLRSCEGATALEFALAVPILFGLLFGVMESGRAMFTRGMIFYAAQEATRWAVAHPKESTQTDAEYDQAVEDYTKSKLWFISPNQTATVTAIGDPDPTTGTRTVSVQVSYTFKFMMPYLSTSDFNFTSSSSGYLIEDLG